MSNNTKIPWTGISWNVMTGCTPISDGCNDCYAKGMAKRLEAMGQEKYQNGFTPTIHPECMNEPFWWKGNKLVFVASMGDLFHKDIPFDFIDKVMEVISQCPQHTFQILTKRAERMYKFFSVHTIPEKYLYILCWQTWEHLTCLILIGLSLVENRETEPEKWKRTGF